MPLTDTKVRNKRAGRTPVKLFDGKGLFLLVKPNGSKLWRYKYRIGGKENLYAIGEYPDVSLSDAREERGAAAKLVKQGIHPSHHRTTARLRAVSEGANTFEAVAREWVAKNKGSWRPYYLRQVENFLKSDVYPHVGVLPIRSVTAAHLLEILRRVEDRGAKTVAVLIRQWCSAIFRYAVATLRADSDPAAALKGAVTVDRVEHRKPLSRTEIPPFLKALEGAAGYRTTVLALHILLRTFVRPVELRGAEWTEFDLDRAEWRIPASRMKMGDEHLVPLSRQAVGFLKELHELTGSQRFLFPNYRTPKTYMSATTLNRALERLGYSARFSAHGFRATASTLLNEMDYRTDVIERQLAHKERNKSRQAYNRAMYLPERKEMMQHWADFIDSLATEKVVPIKATKKG